METQKQLLERAAKQLNMNYTELAKVLGVTRQAISQFNFDSPMSAKTALDLANILKYPPEYVYACTEYSKALRRGDLQSLPVWESIAKQFKPPKSK